MADKTLVDENSEAQDNLIGTLEYRLDVHEKELALLLKYHRLLQKRMREVEKSLSIPIGRRS